MVFCLPRTTRGGRLWLFSALTVGLSGCVELCLGVCADRFNAACVLPLLGSPGNVQDGCNNNCANALRCASAAPPGGLSRSRLPKVPRHSDVVTPRPAAESPLGAMPC